MNFCLRLIWVIAFTCRISLHRSCITEQWYRQDLPHSDLAYLRSATIHWLTSFILRPIRIGRDLEKYLHKVFPESKTSQWNLKRMNSRDKYHSICRLTFSFWNVLIWSVLWSSRSLTLQRTNIWLTRELLARISKDLFRCTILRPFNWHLKTNVIKSSMLLNSWTDRTGNRLWTTYSASSWYKRCQSSTMLTTTSRMQWLPDLRRQPWKLS